MLTWTIVFCLVHCISVLSVEGVSMIINPSSMVVGSNSAIPVIQLELKCLSDGTDNIETVFRLEISRKRFSDSEFVDIAAIDDYTITTNFPQDMRSPNATGSILHSTQGGPPTSGILIVTMDAGSLTCSDQAEFRCTMTYNMKEKAASPVSQSKNFTVITAPNDVHITYAQYEENGVMRRLENDKSYKVGTRIMYRCSANIGSDASLLISWDRSSVMGGSTHFVPYIPAESSDIVQDPVISTNCFNHRTSSMYYNLTNSDSDGITFQCKVRSLLSNEWYESTSVPRRVFTAHSGETTRPTTQRDINISTVVAIVLGLMVGVLIVVILILSICLHRYRKLADILRQEHTRAHTYDDLNKTTQSSGPYAVLYSNPTELQSQELSPNTYDRLNETRQSSGPYAVLNVFPSDGTVR